MVATNRPEEASTMVTLIADKQMIDDHAWMRYINTFPEKPRQRIDRIESKRNISSCLPACSVYLSILDL